MLEIKLGSEAKDSYTGMRGIVTARIEYVTGCVQYEITPTKLKEGVPQNTFWFDVARIVVLKPPKAEKPAVEDVPPGGPQGYHK